MKLTINDIGGVVVKANGFRVKSQGEGERDSGREDNRLGGEEEGGRILNCNQGVPPFQK